MGKQYEEIDFDKLLTSVGNCCYTTAVCGSCKKSSCLIGYAKQSLTKCLIEKVPYVENGVEQLPLSDTRMYEQEAMIHGISETLRQCTSCDKYHFDNCLISVLRNCYEIGLFGEEQPFEGSTFLYFANINEKYPELASRIVAEYKQK